MRWPVAAVAAVAAIPAAGALYLDSRWVLGTVAVGVFVVGVAGSRRFAPLDAASRDAFAALVHVTSAMALASAAVAVTGGLDSGGRYWIRKSWSLHPRKWHTTDDEKFYVAEPRDVLFRVELVWLSLAYAFWSAGVHVARVALQVPPAAPGWKWVDYSVTAPVMLIVIGLLFGVESAWLPVAAGTLCASLAAAGALVEDRGRTALLLLLLLAYGVLWTPLLAAFYFVTVDDGDNTTGTAPVFVPAFGGAMLLLFTSFAVIFLIDYVRKLPDRERYYYGASLISKTSLHLFIGLSAIAQTHTLGVLEGEDARSMDEASTLTYGLGGCVLLIAVLAAVTSRGFAAPGEQHSETMLLLLEWS